MENWEARCERCGRCCYEKLDVDGEIIYTDTPCEFLDLEKRHCTVYQIRHQERHGCMPINQEVLERGILPGDCPYVRDIPGYPAPNMEMLSKV